MRRAGPDDIDLLKELFDHEDIDPTRWLADPRNILMIEGENCLVCLWRWIGIYEVHISFASKGAEATNICREMLDLMLSGPAHMLLAVIPEHLKHVILFARRFGFQFKGTVETIEGTCQMYQLEADQWAS